MTVIINGEIQVGPYPVIQRAGDPQANSEVKSPQSMKVIKITRRDLRLLMQLTVKRRSDCVASFSVNEKHEIWMYVTRGWTKEEKRKYVLGQCPVVERIAEVYLAERPEGGRIFLKRNGLIYRPFGKGSDVPFTGVQFEDRP